MDQFSKNVVTVNVPDPILLDSLRHGFIVRGASGIPTGDVTAHTVITHLPDGRLTIKCWYLGPREPTPSGTAMHSPRDIGYLTQDGVIALRDHKHKNCGISLELHVTQVPT